MEKMESAQSSSLFLNFENDLYLMFFDAMRMDDGNICGRRIPWACRFLYKIG